MSSEKSTTQAFEKQLEDAKKILDQLMDPEITLENSVKAYKTGMQQLTDAQKLLDEAKLEYETIKEQVKA